MNEAAAYAELGVATDVALERAPVALMVHDAEGRIILANAQWRGLTGLDPERTRDLRAWLAAACSAPDEAASAFAIFGGGETGEPRKLRLRASDGSDLNLTLRSVALGRVLGAALRITTARPDEPDRRGLAATREAEQRLSLAVEAGRIGVFDWDLVSGQPSWNDHMREIWGVGAGEPVTIDIFYRGVHPDDRGRVAEVIAAAQAADGDGVYETKYRVVGLSGEGERFVTARGRATFENGRAIRLTGAVIDVTALHEARAVVTRDSAELERLVAARTHDLEEAQGRLAQARRIEAIGHLAGGISHDFNNVLQAVEAGAELIEARSDPESLRRYIKMIRQATKRGAAISRRLLAIARRDDLDAQPIEVDAFLESMKPAIERTLGGDATIGFDIAADLPPMLADARQLETALLNLVANSRDALNRRGAVRISALAQSAAEASASPFRPALKTGRYVRLTLSDSGAGMAPDVLARATEPFFTTKPGGRSAGLGLAMARGFTEQSGGELRIESAPEAGTTVALWLPVAEPAPAADPFPPRAPESRTAGARGRLLVVDDDALVRESLEEQLKAAGYSVATANDGSSAVKLIDQGAPIDLVLSDFAMPGMDGVAFLRRARELRSDLPAILLTGFATEAAKMAAGEFVLLRKPIERDVLLARIETMLARASR